MRTAVIAYFRALLAHVQTRAASTRDARVWSGQRVLNRADNSDMETRRSVERNSSE
ncbi:hypothetical protein BCAR13_740003 [Paraburkholderia caribensis]|nr:hypothetical protein BCAR13_740003 [Paraburkholderia caribensis]